MVLRAIPGANAVGRPTSLRDDERGVEFRSRGSVGMGRTSVFELVWPGGCAGVSAFGPDPIVDHGTEYALWEDVRVGEKEILFTGPNIDAHRFSSEEERRQVTCLSIECLLVYGIFFNGLELPAGSCRVLFDGKEYRREDFGYRV